MQWICLRVCELSNSFVSILSNFACFLVFGLGMRYVAICTIREQEVKLKMLFWVFAKKRITTGVVLGVCFAVLWYFPSILFRNLELSDFAWLYLSYYTFVFLIGELTAIVYTEYPSLSISRIKNWARFLLNNNWFIIWGQVRLLCRYLLPFIIAFFLLCGIMVRIIIYCKQKLN